MQAERAAVMGPGGLGDSGGQMSAPGRSPLGAPAHMSPSYLLVHSTCGQSWLLRLFLCKTQLGF